MSATGVSWDLESVEEFGGAPQQPRVSAVSNGCGGVELRMRIGKDGVVLKRSLDRDEVASLAKALSFASECE